MYYIISTTKIISNPTYIHIPRDFSSDRLGSIARVADIDHHINAETLESRDFPHQSTPHTHGIR